MYKYNNAGRPRGLVVALERYYTSMLVREFESRRGESLILFVKKEKEKDQLLRAPLPWVSTTRRESTREERAEIFSR